MQPVSTMQYFQTRFSDLVKAAMSMLRFGRRFSV